MKNVNTFRVIKWKKRQSLTASFVTAHWISTKTVRAIRTLSHVKAERKSKTARIAPSRTSRKIMKRLCGFCRRRWSKGRGDRREYIWIRWRRTYESRPWGRLSGGTGIGAVTNDNKKVKKGKSAELIASGLEEEVSVIQPLYDAVAAEVPKYDMEKSGRPCMEHFELQIKLQMKFLAILSILWNNKRWIKSRW